MSFGCIFISDNSGATQEVSGRIFEHVTTEEPQVFHHDSKNEEAEPIYSKECALGSTSTTEGIYS